MFRLGCLKVHMHKILKFVFHVFWHHPIKDKAEVQTFKKFVKWRVKFSYKIGFSQIPRYRQKRTVSLRIFGENATFHSAYSPKSRNYAPSLNMLYTAESTQFNSPFSPITISLTPHFCRKVWHFYAENAQNDPKTHNYEDNAKFHSAFLPTKLSYASRFQRNQGVIEKFEYLGEIEEENLDCTAFCIY